MVADVLHRRVFGASLALLVVGLGTWGLGAVAAPPAGSYEVLAELGNAGSGLFVGTDVKARGVLIGEVSELRYDDGRAFAVLLLDGDPPIPADTDVIVAQKTLLGEKQVELQFTPEQFTSGPYLADGDAIVSSRPPTELDAVIDKLTPFLDAIDAEDVATVVDTLGALQGEGDTIARNIEVGSELAAFGARTADETIARLNRLANIADDLNAAANDIDRLGATTPDGVALLIDRQGDISQTLQDVTTSTTILAEWLEVERRLIDRLLDTGEPVGALLEEHADFIGDGIQGFYRYAYKLGHAPLTFMSDGSGFGGFRILVDEDGVFSTFCEDAGPLGGFIPACAG